jgi:hypothetical protein
LDSKLLFGQDWEDGAQFKRTFPPENGYFRNCFFMMTKNYTQLFSLDISHCPNIEEASVLTVLHNNQGLERFFAARTQKAVTDRAIHQLAALEGVKFYRIMSFK